MEVRAKAKYIHRSPKKVRLVVDVVRGMNVLAAQDQLKFLGKAAVRPVLKLLNSAIINAEHNFQLNKDNLYIKEIFVDEGQALKRWRPRAFGRAAPIKKRTSHINLVLAEITPAGGKNKVQKVAAKERPIEKNKVPSEGMIEGRPIAPKELSKETEEHKKELFDKYRVAKRVEPAAFKKESKKGKGFLKRIFRRKSV